MYWADAEFPLHKPWNRENMNPALVKLERVPLDNVPGLHCCPFGKYMDLNIGGWVRLPSSYDTVEPQEFLRFKDIFNVAHHKISTNGVFTGAKPFVAEALRRNERSFFSAYDSYEDTRPYEKRRKEDIRIDSVNPVNNPKIKPEHATYSIVLDGPFVTVGANGLYVGERYYFFNAKIDAEKPRYSQALFHIFEINPSLMNYMCRDFKPNRFVGEIRLESFLEQNHEAIALWLRSGRDEAVPINWALRTIADHDAFRRNRPEIDLETLVN